MDWYGLGAAALIGLAFYGLHRIPAFLAGSAAVVGGFIAVTYPSLAVERVSEWLVMTTGLVASFLGLVIVRVMLMRSVSLQLLARIDGADTGSFHDDTRDRLNDLRAFRLVRSAGDANTLTPFGRLIGGVVAASYWAFRITP